MQLSKHFPLEDALFSQTATREGILNIPSPEQLRCMTVAAAGMELVRGMLDDKPCHVTSWLRVEELERIITRKDFAAWCIRHGFKSQKEGWKVYFPRKAHPQGYAIDFVCRDFGTPSQVVDRIRSSKIRYDQLIMEQDWVHISFAPALRMQVMTATFVDGTPTYKERVK